MNQPEKQFHVGDVVQMGVHRRSLLEWLTRAPVKPRLHVVEATTDNLVSLRPTDHNTWYLKTEVAVFDAMKSIR